MAKSKTDFSGKITASTVDIKCAIIEVIIGAAILIAAFLVCPPDYLPIALAIGVYFAFMGVWKSVSFWLINLIFEKGRYISLTNEGVLFHSPKPQKCCLIPYDKIEKISKMRGFGIDIFTDIVQYFKGSGSIIIQYKDENGKLAAVSFGDIDHYKDFIAAVETKQRQIKAAAKNA